MESLQSPFEAAQPGAQLHPVGTKLLSCGAEIGRVGLSARKKAEKNRPQLKKIGLVSTMPVL